MDGDGGTLHSHYDSWDRLQKTPATLSAAGIEEGWMDGWMYNVYFARSRHRTQSCLTRNVGVKPRDLKFDPLFLLAK